MQDSHGGASTSLHDHFKDEDNQNQKQQSAKETYEHFIQKRRKVTETYIS